MIRRDNLTIPQGTDWAVRWSFIDNNGKPIDTSGWTVRAHVRRRANAPEILHEWSTEEGNAIAEDSYVQISVPHDVSTPWRWLQGVYDLEVTDADGIVTRITSGTVKLLPEITR